MKPDLAQRIRTLIAEVFDVGLERVTDEATLEGLGADSLDVAELALATEREFEIGISDEEMEKLVTVGDVVALVERLREREEV